MSQYVAVTGMGVVCSLGCNRDEVMTAIKTSQEGVFKVKGIDLSGLSTQLGGEVEFEDVDFSDELQDKMSRMSYMAFCEAYESSGLDFSSLDPYKIGLSFGTCNGNVLSLESCFESAESDPDKVKLLFQHYFNGIDYLNKVYPIKGEKVVFVTACAASNQALGYAKDLIVSGQCDVVVVGGADSFSKATFAGFNSLQALHEKRCSPFSKALGISLGEGAGFMILENIEHAQVRQAKIYGYVLGYGFGGDAYHATSPDITGEGARRCMQLSLEDAGLEAEDVFLICAHGTGTEANDKTETLAIKSVFSSHADSLFITSTKSMHGHTLGASGIVQSVMCLDALNEGFVPPILNFTQHREGCDLNYVKNEPVVAKGSVFLSNSFAFGGNNVSVAFGNQDFASLKSVVSRDLSTRSVITCFSCLSPLFDSSDAFLACLQENKSYVSNRRTLFFDSFFVSDLSLRRFRKSPRLSQLAIEVSGRVLKESLLDLKSYTDLGLLWGVAKGPIRLFESYYCDMLDQGLPFASALRFPHTVQNSVAGQVSIAYQVKGQNTTFSGQFSPFSALFYADRLIKAGYHSGYLVGGADELALLDEVYIKSSVFDGQRISEGAGALLVESYASALDRGATVLAVIQAYESTSSFWDDNYALSYEICIERCLKKAGLAPMDIDLHLVNHFGNQDLLRSIPRVGRSVLCDLQRLIGICESSSAVFSIAAALLCFQHQFMPSIDGAVYKKQVNYILISGSSINGNHYCLILGHRDV